MSQQNKSIFYIDGFNLYFSLKSNNWKKYYWLNLVLLSSKLLFPGHSLIKVKYFTAPVRKPSDKVKRQQAFLNALETLETLEIIYGKYQYNEMKCFDCGRIIPVPKEKKTDVNIASQMVIDAVANKCDIQYLLTGDSDLTPPIRLIKEHFPKRKIFLICPPKTIIRSIKNLKVPLYGDGMQIRSWIYVNDHVQAIETLISKGKSGQVYNITAYEEIPNKTIVEKILDILEKPHSMIEYVGDRPGHDKRYSIDCTKIENQTKWRPQYKFDDALQQTVTWYLENQSWWEPLINDMTLHPQPWTINLK